MSQPVQSENIELTDEREVGPGDGPVPGDESVSLAYPEGGMEAWSCLLGAFLMMFPSFGFQTAGI